MQPHDIETVVQCYPRLIEAGQTALAEEVFTTYDLAMQKHIARWPNDSTALNNLAWMYAKCDRKLDAALRLARHASDSAPHSAVYLDTLAEVEFRLGHTSRALELTKQCICLDPRESHYRENLVRFRKATSLK